MFLQHTGPFLKLLLVRNFDARRQVHMLIYSGIFCVCMPALRRWLANMFPKCFGSTQTNSKYEHYDTPNTPNKLSNGRSKNSKASISFGRATFGGTGITKTMDTRVESRSGEDDEIELVAIGKERQMKGGWQQRASEGDGESERSGGGVPHTTQGPFLQS